MILSIKDLKRDFGLEDELVKVLNNPTCQGKVHVYTSFSKGLVTLKFDNIFEFFEFLIEAKELIEKRIWGGISFSSTIKRGAKPNKQVEHDCFTAAITIDARVQEILAEYVEISDYDLSTERGVLLNSIKDVKKVLLNLEQLI